MQRANNKQETMRVYYFTSSEYAISNLALKRIKISRYQDLNDPFELLSADLTDQRVRRELRKVKKKIEEQQGIICFSKTWHNPLLWGHYADKHKGIALGFDIPTSMLNEVEYKEELSEITVAKCSNPLYIRELSLTKFQHWEYESEYRLHIDLKTLEGESGFYFKYFSDEINLQEVILGVKCNIPISSMRAFFEERHEEVKVIQSRIAYKDFKIVENRLVTNG
ncbi:DUF2971 domain-containing protein [Dryocola clanedunensis]